MQSDYESLSLLDPSIYNLMYIIIFITYVSKAWHVWDVLPNIRRQKGHADFLFSCPFSYQKFPVLALFYKNMSTSLIVMLQIFFMWGQWTDEDHVARWSHYQSGLLRVLLSQPRASLPHHLVSWSGGQAEPPRRGCLTIGRLRVVSPMPQAELQEDQGPHSPTLQSRGASVNWKRNCVIKFLLILYFTKPTVRGLHWSNWLKDVYVK